MRFHLALCRCCEGFAPALQGPGRDGAPIRRRAERHSRGHLPSAVGSHKADTKRLHGRRAASAPQPGASSLRAVDLPHPPLQRPARPLAAQGATLLLLDDHILLT